MPLPTKLVIPDLEKAALAEAASEFTGDALALLSLQARSVNLLKRLPTADATAEHLALLALWSRLFALLESARFAASQNDTYGLTFCDRAASEASLQVSFIANDVVTAAQPQSQARLLRAFLAWSIWNDRESDLRFLGKIHEFWNGDSTKRLMESPKAFELFETLGGPIEVANQHELDAEREEQEAKFRRRIELKTDWLSDSQLAEWTKRLDEAREATLKSKPGRNNVEPMSFYTLATGKRGGAAALMRAANLEMAYPMYAFQSGVLHGSTLEPFLEMARTLAAPKLPRTSPEGATIARGIRGALANQLVGLELIFHTLLKSRA